MRSSLLIDLQAGNGSRSKRCRAPSSAAAPRSASRRRSCRRSMPCCGRTRAEAAHSPFRASEGKRDTHTSAAREPRKGECPPSLSRVERQVFPAPSAMRRPPAARRRGSASCRRRRRERDGRRVRQVSERAVGFLTADEAAGRSAPGVDAASSAARTDTDRRARPPDWDCATSIIPSITGTTRCTRCPRDWRKRRLLPGPHAITTIE